MQAFVEGSKKSWHCHRNHVAKSRQCSHPYEAPWTNWRKSLRLCHRVFGTGALGLCLLNGKCNEANVSVFCFRQYVTDQLSTPKIFNDESKGFASRLAR